MEWSSGEFELWKNKLKHKLKILNKFSQQTLIITFCIPESLLVWGAMASAVGKLNSLAENETFPSLPMEPPALSQLPLEPYFDSVSPRNVTALVGKSAYLTCRVRNLGDKTVSHMNMSIFI